MPRLEIGGDYSPKPVGVLPCKVIDMRQCSPSDPDVPKMKNLTDAANIAVIGFTVLPEDHDRSHTIWVAIKPVFKDGQISLKESRGIQTLNKICEKLGTTTMGFNASGSFVDEDDQLVQVDDICATLFEEILKKDDFRVLVHIYKEKAKDGKQYFRAGLNLHTVGEEKWAAKAAEQDLKFQAMRNGNLVDVPNPHREDEDGDNNPPEDPEDNPEPERRAAKPGRAFANRQI